MTNPFTTITNWVKVRFPRRRNRNGTKPDTSAQAERKLVHTLAKSRLPSLRQLRYLPRVITEGERLLLRALTGFIVVALLFLGTRVYSRNVVPLPRPGGEIVEALIGTPQYVNPLLASTNDIDRDLVRLVYAGLMKRNERQELIPDIAERYDVSDDKKTYTFQLRTNLSWSDGQPLTVDDVLLTFELIQDPLYKSPIRSQFRNVKVERVDDRSVRFTLPQPSAAFLSHVTVGILPAHIWGDVPPPNFALVEFNLKPIGSGPFAFDVLKRDGATGSVKEYRFIRNERYHGDRPFLNRLTFKIYADFESALEALRSKMVEGISFITKEERAGVKQVRAIDLRLPQYTAIFFNSKRSVVRTLEVRKAFAQALDRTRIITEVFKDSVTLVDGPLPPKFPGHAGRLQPDFDPDAANATLEAAGWIRPAGSSVRKKGNDELALTLMIVEQPDDRTVAEIIKENWEAIGAKVEIHAHDPTRIPKEVIKPRDFDAFLYGEIISPDGDLYPFWHSSQEQDPGLNLTRFFNKDADKLLEELRTTTDPNQQAEKRIAFQRLLADGLPAIFLYSPFYSYGLPKRVKGFEVKYVTIPADRFAGIEHWYVKTRISFK